jgi:anti-anti-sigma factor
MPLYLDSRFCGNVCILHCKGQIILGEEVKKLEAELEMTARSFCQIVISVQDVTRLDSIGLGLLVRCMTNMRKRGGDLRLAAPPPFLHDLLKMTRLNGLLQSFDSDDEATRSFLEKAACAPARDAKRPRVLVIDRCADLGAFIRAVLTQHGYEVNSVSLIRDARTLLQFQPVDFILLGPGTGQTAPAEILASLRTMGSGAATLELCPDFRSFDAHQAADVLLAMFQAGAAPA